MPSPEHNARTTRALRAGPLLLQGPDSGCIHPSHGTERESPRHVFPPQGSGALGCELPSLWEAPAFLSENVPPAAAESPNNRETRGKGIKGWLSRCRVLLTLFVLNDHESKGGEKKTHKWKLN